MPAPKTPEAKAEWKRRIRDAHVGMRGHHHSEATKKKMSDTQKGIPRLWLLGHKTSEETKRKISEAQKGRPVPLERREKLRLAQLGKHHSDETKQKLRASHLGKKYRTPSPEARKRMSEGQKGKRYSPETRAFWSAQRKGEKHWNWKGGLTPLPDKFRTSPEYRQWRKAVLARDDYRCIDCGERGGRLEVDHIYPYKYFPRLRLMLENGITRCHDCHKKTPTYGLRVRNYMKTHAFAS